MGCDSRFVVLQFSWISRNFVPYPLYFGVFSLLVWDFAGEFGVVVALICGFGFLNCVVVDDSGLSGDLLFVWGYCLV